MSRRPPVSPLFPYTTLFRSVTSGGIVATQQVAESAPDGHTLLVTFDTFAINPFLFKGVQWDPVHAFEEEGRSEEHTPELQSQFHYVCRLLLEKKKIVSGMCQ